MICTVYVRRPSSIPLMVTTTEYISAALGLVEEIVKARGLPWSCEVAEWVPNNVNIFIQGATVTDASTLMHDGNPVAVIRVEIDDIILSSAQKYLNRRKLSGELRLVAGITPAIKAAINAAAHTPPVGVP